MTEQTTIPPQAPVEVTRDGAAFVLTGPDGATSRTTNEGRLLTAARRVVPEGVSPYLVRLDLGTA